MLNPEAVKRDEHGYWLHSALRPSPQGARVQVPDIQGMETAHVAFEDDAPNWLYQAWVLAVVTEVDITEWQPTPPEGDGWFLIGIYKNADEEPIATFARPRARA